MEERLREPVFRLTWEGEDVTRHLSPHVLALNYVDYSEGKSDSIEVTLEDREDLWKGDWFPEKGDRVSAEIGYRDGPILPCGTFEIDTVEYTGAPDTVRISGVSADVRKAMRQRDTRGYESTTLSKILRTVAKRHGLKPQTDIHPDITFARIDQRDQTDLNFIRTLAGPYGYAVKVAQGKLIALKIEDVEKQDPALTIKRAKNMRFSIRNTLNDVYRGVKVSYFEPLLGKTQTHFEKAPDWDSINPEIRKADVHKLNERVENKLQARERAKGALKRLNRWEVEGDLDLTGMPEICSGITLRLEGWKKLDGVYVVEETRHTIERGQGYTTAVRIRRGKDLKGEKASGDTIPLLSGDERAVEHDGRE